MSHTISTYKSALEGLLFDHSIISNYLLFIAKFHGSIVIHYVINPLVACQYNDPIKLIVYTVYIDMKVDDCLFDELDKIDVQILSWMSVSNRSSVVSIRLRNKTHLQNSNTASSNTSKLQKNPRTTPKQFPPDHKNN